MNLVQCEFSQGILYTIISLTILLLLFKDSWVDLIKPGDPVIVEKNGVKVKSVVIKKLNKNKYSLRLNNGVKIISERHTLMPVKNYDYARHKYNF